MYPTPKGSKTFELLEALRVELPLANVTHDGRRMKVRNTFYRDSDGARVASVSLARTDDFAWYDDKAT
jgi:hypothetical protein